MKSIRRTIYSGKREAESIATCLTPNSCCSPVTAKNTGCLARARSDSQASIINFIIDSTQLCQSVRGKQKGTVATDRICRLVRLYRAQPAIDQMLLSSQYLRFFYCVRLHHKVTFRCSSSFTIKNSGHTA